MQVSSITASGSQKTVTVKDSLWNKHTIHNYTVPNEKFDEFTSEIQKEGISWKKKTRATLILGTIAGAVVGAAASKNASGAVQTVSSVLCALAGAALSALSLSQVFDIKHRALLSKYGAEPESGAQ